MNAKGKIKWFDHERGFGFVVVPNVGDALLHRDEIVDYQTVKDQLVPGQWVKFFAVYKIKAVQATLIEAPSKDDEAA